MAHIDEQCEKIWREQPLEDLPVPFHRENVSKSTEDIGLQGSHFTHIPLSLLGVCIQSREKSREKCLYSVKRGPARHVIVNS